MRAEELLGILGRVTETRLRGPGEAEFSGIAYHSLKVKPGDLFAALPGRRDDGARHLAEALQRGASVVLCSLGAPEAEDLGGGAAILGAADVRLALAHAADAFWGRPSRGMRTVGITGTNGKTTLTYLVEGMAREAGHLCGIIGTIEYRVGKKSRRAERTTPEAPDLQRLLRWMADEGAGMAAVEVSSHSLALRRVDATSFAFGVFTNLSQDHLDFHGDMEEYYRAKRRLFTDFGLEAAVINLDDPWGRRLAGEAGAEVVGYGRQPDCHIRPKDVRMSAAGLDLTLDIPGGALRLHSPLTGGHNVENVMAAAALGWRMGFTEEAIREGLASVRDVPGRFQKVSGPGEPLVVVDYAHTPDALEKLLESARRVTAGRLVLVFGCGGDRDRAKRPLMGMEAAAGADEVLITTDNPRSEEPEAIMREIEEGYLGRRSDGYRLVADRREAIMAAVASAGPEDTVLIAGKGHEDYQIVGPRTLHFDDRECAREALRRRAKE